MMKKHVIRCYKDVDLNFKGGRVDVDKKAPDIRHFEVMPGINGDRPVVIYENIS